MRPHAEYELGTLHSMASIRAISASTQSGLTTTSAPRTRQRRRSSLSSCGPDRPTYNGAEYQLPSFETLRLLAGIMKRPQRALAPALRRTAFEKACGRGDGDVVADGDGDGVGGMNTLFARHGDLAVDPAIGFRLPRSSPRFIPSGCQRVQALGLPPISGSANTPAGVTSGRRDRYAAANRASKRVAVLRN